MEDDSFDLIRAEWQKALVTVIRRVHAGDEIDPSEPDALDPNNVGGYVAARASTPERAPGQKQPDEPEMAQSARVRRRGHQARRAAATPRRRVLLGLAVGGPVAASVASSPGIVHDRHAARRRLSSTWAGAHAGGALAGIRLGPAILLAARPAPADRPGARWHGSVVERRGPMVVRHRGRRGRTGGAVAARPGSVVGVGDPSARAPVGRDDAAKVPQPDVTPAQPAATQPATTSVPIAAATASEPVTPWTRARAPAAAAGRPRSEKGDCWGRGMQAERASPPSSARSTKQRR
jgi:hypothetical protein